MNTRKSDREHEHIEEVELSADDVKTALEEYELQLRESQVFCNHCPEEIQDFLDPILKLAGDMIHYLCDANSINPMELEAKSFLMYMDKYGNGGNQ